MARRRKNDGLADVLVMLPWWVSIALGCVAFAAMRWIVPSIFASSPLLIGLALMSRSLAWLPFLLFGFVGAVAFARSKMAEESMGSVGSARVEPRSVSASSVNTHRTKLDHAWDSAARNVTGAAHGWGASNQTVVEPVKAEDVFNAWTLDALRALEWKRFELLCAKYYEAVGFKSETIRCGADGGIDVKLFKIDPNKPIAVVQCKAWTGMVGVAPVRELLGVMAHEKVERGVFITTGTYSKDALSFGASNPIQLLDGAAFVKKLQELPKERQDALLKYAFDGDYKTPTCASCGIKMTARESNRGPFWGCVNYPRCKSRLAIRS